MSGTIDVPGSQLSFVIAQSERGFFDDKPQIVAEELVTPGVSGSRWRTVYLQYPEFGFRTISSGNSFNNLVNAKHKVEEKMVQRSATITYTVAGVTYKMRQAQLISVSAQIIPGPLYGADVTSGSQAHLICDWRIKCNYFSTED